MSEVIGDRVRLIRERRGEQQPAFAATLNAAARRLKVDANYDNTTVSKMETGRREVTLVDVMVIASVDHDQRGRDWLAWDDGGDGIHATIVPPRRKIGERIPDPRVKPTEAGGEGRKRA